jgi:hypothetical protein
MSDWARLHRDLADHPKFQEASLPAVGLWALGIAKTRQLRSAGRLTHKEALELARGDESLIKELLGVGLWERSGDAYIYHDWLEHNGDHRPRTTAARMVGEVLGERYPAAVAASLAAKVAELLNEGQEVQAIRAALKLWSDQPDAGIGLLPFLVARVIRDNQAGDLRALLRASWKSGDVTPLRRHGYWFTPPDIPPDIKTPDRMQAWMLSQKRLWIKDLEKELK